MMDDHISGLSFQGHLGMILDELSQLPMCLSNGKITLGSLEETSEETMVICHVYQLYHGLSSKNPENNDKYEYHRSFP